MLWYIVTEKGISFHNIIVPYGIRILRDEYDNHASLEFDNIKFSEIHGFLILTSVFECKGFE